MSVRLDVAVQEGRQVILIGVEARVERLEGFLRIGQGFELSLTPCPVGVRSTGGSYCTYTEKRNSICESPVTFAAHAQRYSA
jgi:hypothetical protein